MGMTSIDPPPHPHCHLLLLVSQGYFSQVLKTDYSSFPTSFCLCGAVACFLVAESVETVEATFNFEPGALNQHYSQLVGGS